MHLHILTTCTAGSFSLCHSLSCDGICSLQAAALRYHSQGRKKHSHSSTRGSAQPSMVRLRQVLFQDENSGRVMAEGSSKRRQHNTGTLSTGVPSRDPLQVLQHNRHANGSAAPAQLTMPFVQWSQIPVAKAPFAEAWLPAMTAQASSRLVPEGQADCELQSAGSANSVDSPAAGCKLAAAVHDLDALILQD